VRRGAARTRATVASTALVGATLLAACSGGGSARSASHASTQPTSAPSPVPACQAAQLRPSLRMPDAGAGQRYVLLVLLDTGAPCQMTGYVGLQLLGAGGAPIPTVVSREAGRLVPVSLEPGGAASTPLHWAGIPLSDEAQDGPCEPQPAQVEITPPDQTAFATTAWTLDPVCGHGRIDVQPLVRGVPAP
jgi:FtsP/CotA-like multicopper oxidase with cupredoxin domain